MPGDNAVKSVDVRDFGAIGDGKADDTAAIQDAIDHVGDVGGGAYRPVRLLGSISILENEEHEDARR